MLYLNEVTMISVAYIYVRLFWKFLSFPGSCSHFDGVTQTWSQTRFSKSQTIFVLLFKTAWLATNGNVSRRGVPITRKFSGDESWSNGCSYVHRTKIVISLNFNYQSSSLTVIFLLLLNASWSEAYSPVFPLQNNTWAILHKCKYVWHAVLSMYSDTAVVDNVK